jgi:hypothetical protein
MGLVKRKKSGRKINGSKLNVPGQGISSVQQGGSQISQPNNNANNQP